VNCIFASSLVQQYVISVTVLLDYYLCGLANDVWGRNGATCVFSRYYPPRCWDIAEKNAILWKVNEF